MTNFKSNHFPDNFYRVSVKGLCVREGEIMLLKESEAASGKWELPGGGLDFGEDIHEGLKREIEEETGLKITKIGKLPKYIWTTKFENERKMDWYYSLVLGYEIEVENFDFTPSDECEEIGFFSKVELEGIELCEQAKGLKQIFNPTDF
jgi:8-oxo-dGTP diphosphatase